MQVQIERMYVLYNKESAREEMTIAERLELIELLYANCFLTVQARFTETMRVQQNIKKMSYDEQRERLHDLRAKSDADELTYGEKLERLELQLARAFINMSDYNLERNRLLDALFSAK